VKVLLCSKNRKYRREIAHLGLRRSAHPSNPVLSYSPPGAEATGLRRDAPSTGLTQLDPAGLEPWRWLTRHSSLVTPPYTPAPLHPPHYNRHIIVLGGIAGEGQNSGFEVVQHGLSRGGWPGGDQVSQAVKA